MRDCVVMNAISPSEKEEAISHPTAKPKRLIKMFINQFTEEGDVVLDIFSGSGTTACVCALMKRNFIGFEIDKTYYEQSLKRLRNYKEQTGLKEWVK